MTTSYDPIAEQYKRSKLQPWRTYIECFTLMKLIGDPRGLTVLDVGCGEGFYTRMVRERGAAHVTGIDLSHRMIELARTQEAQQRLGIEYVVGDARELPATRQFDLVIAAYVLNYAHDPQELQMMYDGLARCVRTGGSSPSIAARRRRFGMLRRIASTDSRRACEDAGRRGCRSPGPSTWMMDPSRSRTTIWARRRTRPRVASPGSGSFGGILPNSRRKG